MPRHDLPSAQLCQVEQRAAVGMVVSKTSRKRFQINIQKRCLKDVSQQHISRDGISIQQIDQITLGVPRTGKVADSELGQFIRLLNNPKSLRRFREYLGPFK